MELELVGRDDKSVAIKIIGEDHTLCNALRRVLYEDENVVAAAYSIEHPLLEHPKLYVKVREKSPERALVAAAERLMKRGDEFRHKLLEALKE